MDVLKRKLAVYQKKTISLPELEKMLNPYIQTYEEFAISILQLEKANILTMVKTKGRTTRTPSLAFQFYDDI